MSNRASRHPPSSRPSRHPLGSPDSAAPILPDPTPWKRRPAHVPLRLPGADQAFLRLRPRLDALPGSALSSPPTVDVQAAALVALGVSGFVAQPDVAARFARLAATGEMDASAATSLEDAALACWYARHQYLLADATATEARVPATLVERAGTLKARMLKVAEYHLGEHSSAGARVAAIRAGQGHLDLANDLVALAELYSEHAAALLDDPRHYRDADTAEARQIAAQLLAHLGGTADRSASQWLDLQHRAWTHLLAVYEEVRRGGRFLYHGDESGDRFPSLYTAARKPRRSPEEPQPPSPGA